MLCANVSPVLLPILALGFCTVLYGSLRTFFKIKYSFSWAVIISSFLSLLVINICGAN